MEKRKIVLEQVKRELSEMRDRIGDGTESEHLSDKLLSNSFNDLVTTGQMYENLASVYYQLGRVIDVMDLEPDE